MRGGLGFKKLHEFNLALLAKQGWRLLINPGSLVSKLLKAKYYPTTNFLQAKIGNNPSYLWRSIIAGQDILRRGVARRIGDGGNSKLWEWGWLADNTNPMLHTPYIEELSEARVSGLMTSDRHWDIDILTDIFVEADVQRILATPINTIFPDSWRWIGDLRGQYTVKHGYRMLMEDSNGDGLQTFKAWKSLWSLLVPPKTKNLLWRSAREILPTREKLKTRQVWIGGGCPLGDFPAETQEHLFVECWFATELWGQNDLLQGRSWIEVLEACITGSDGRVAVRIAAIVEVLWSARNECVWKGTTPSLLSMRRKVQELQNVWEDNFGKHGSMGRVTNTIWSPSPRGSLKCNVDAAIFPNGMGFGAVIHNHSGRFVAAESGFLANIHDPFMAEVIAAKEALSWLKTLRSTSISVESDCLNLCTAFNSSTIDFSYVGLIIKQCIAIAKDIGDVCVNHVKRSANRVAHELARATGSETVSGEWAVIPPTCISGLLSY